MGKTKILKVWALISTIVVGLIISMVSTAVLAVSGGSLSVFPADNKEHPGTRSWFVYEADPGTVIKDKVEIFNQDDQATTVNVAVLDGATTNDGGYTLVGAIDQNKDIGTWAQLSKTQVTLPAKSKTTIDLTITVPENADVGSHAGGVVAWRSTDGEPRGDAQLKVVTRVAARMYLTVPGDIIRKLDISNVRHTITKGVLYFHMTFHNDGNVTLTPEANISLRGIFGNVGEQDRSQFGMILRGGTINARVPWQKKAPIFGRFVADFRVHYGEKDFKNEYVKDEYQDVRYVFWIIPWMMILWSVIGILLLLFIRKFWIWVLIKQRLNTKTTKHTVRKGENISIISRLYNVDIKKIARFNLLKWPYDLLPGDILLIPQGKMTKEERKLLPDDARTKSVIPSLSRDLRDSSTSVGMTKGAVGMTRGDLEPVIIEAGDTVKAVAEFAEVSVKEIIKLNRLKWPYKLRAGQELFIPIISSIKERSAVPTKSLKPVKIKVKSVGRKTSSRLSKKTAGKLNKSNKSSTKKPKR